MAQTDPKALMRVPGSIRVKRPLTVITLNFIIFPLQPNAFYSTFTTERYIFNTCLMLMHSPLFCIFHVIAAR